MIKSLLKCQVYSLKLKSSYSSGLRPCWISKVIDSELLAVLTRFIFTGVCNVQKVQRLKADRLLATTIEQIYRWVFRAYFLHWKVYTQKGRGPLLTTPGIGKAQFQLVYIAQLTQHTEQWISCLNFKVDLISVIVLFFDSMQPSCRGLQII